MAKKILELTEEAAIKAYKEGSTADRKLLENLYGSKIFNMKITDRIKTIDDIFMIAGVDPAKYRITADMDEEEEFSMRGKRLRLIGKVLNEDVVIDYRNSNQYKWRPWFKPKVNSSGFGFSHSRYGYGNTYACVGSRFASEALSDFAGKTFEEEYSRYIELQ